MYFIHAYTNYRGYFRVSLSNERLPCVGAGTRVQTALWRPQSFPAQIVLSGRHRLVYGGYSLAKEWSMEFTHSQIVTLHRLVCRGQSLAEEQPMEFTHSIHGYHARQLTQVPGIQ